MNRLRYFLAPILTGLACGVIAAEEPAAGDDGEEKEKSE